MTPPRTYLDYNATTPPDPAVVAAMQHMLTTCWANPSSGHLFGAEAAQAVEAARRSVARLINAQPADLVFTSGGTEADNTALRGVLAAQPAKRHLVVSRIEHHAVFELAEKLEHEGVAVTWLDVDTDGQLDLQQLADVLRPDTALVAVMLANNETGVVYPLRQIADIAHARGVPVFSDAVNALGKIAVDVQALGVDLLALSGHKVYGPKGVGALYVRPGTPLAQWQTGGGQEHGRRGGTLNAPGIVGLGKACELLAERRPWAQPHLGALRDQLEARLTELGVPLRFVGRKAPRLPNTACVCFVDRIGADLVALLSERGVCVSAGAACVAGHTEPSHVMRALRVPPEAAGGQLRFSLGLPTTAAEIDTAVAALKEVLADAT